MNKHVAARVLTAPAMHTARPMSPITLDAVVGWPRPPRGDRARPDPLFDPATAGPRRWPR